MEQITSLPGSATFIFQYINGVAKSLIKLEKRFDSHLKGMENLFEATSKINKESKMHLEECLQVESSNDDIMVEAEQKLHSIQEEAKKLALKRDEISKVFFSLIYLIFVSLRQYLYIICLGLEILQ